VNIKKVFSEVDDFIIVWCQAKNIKKESQVSMEWYNPEGKLVFTINIDVKPTNQEHPYRYFWSVMRYNFINAIKGKVFGVWKVKIKPFDIEYEFVIKDLKSYSLFKESKTISGALDEIV